MGELRFRGLIGHLRLYTDLRIDKDRENLINNCKGKIWISFLIKLSNYARNQYVLIVFTSRLKFMSWILFEVWNKEITYINIYILLYKDIHILIMSNYNLNAQVAFSFCTSKIFRIGDSSWKVVTDDLRP